MSDYSLGLYEKAMPATLSFEQMLIAAKESGFDFCELSIDETDERLARLDNRRSEIDALRAAMNKTGVRFRTMCLSAHRKYPLGSHNEETRGKSLEITAKAIDFAHALGVRIIQLAGYDVYYEESNENTRLWFTENLRKAVEMAAAKCVLLAFETMETPFMDTVEKAMTFVSLIGSPYLKIYPDIGNLTNASKLYNTNVADDIRLGKGFIAAAHLKETKPGIYRNVPFGTGHTDYAACIAALYAQGVRTFTGEFWDAGEKNWQQTLTASAQFLREKLVFTER